MLFRSVVDPDELGGDPRELREGQDLEVVLVSPQGAQEVGHVALGG